MNLRPNRPEPPDINLTPLLDVVFLLLIFFMVSTTFKEDAHIRLQLPEAQGEDVTTREHKTLDILIDRSGTVYVKDRMVVDRKLNTLKKAIAGASAGDLEIPVVIKADARTPHQAVMTVMDAASQLGMQHFVFAATRPEESR
jgi:biopolymer transport protein ExbD